ncbi:MAG: sulfite exporter TauE/SafE family protein [Synergistaceae bacterium]|jgi:sulfite exporter TauE/SafE/copper chaperone CopZ|nr:sulfite exporter TauE/SafE family protein [Synergistaceae bacterium]
MFQNKIQGVSIVMDSKYGTWTETVHIEGMTCVNCQNRIEKKLRESEGVLSAKVDYGEGTAEVVFDDTTDLSAIVSVIENLDYKAYPSDKKRNKRSEWSNFIGTLLLILAFYMFLNGSGGGFLGSVFNIFPQAEAGMGYWALFAVGVMTSVHCVAMCGGINLSQSLSGPGKETRREKSPFSLSGLRPAILYNSGRVASYSLVGGIVGALGSAISFSGAMKGIVQIIAGIFMIVLGLNMLGTFGFLRAFAPRPPKFLTGFRERGKRKGPLFVGLLNGLMPCGPLQAMQIYALSTGSPLKGALSMFFFSLGTFPTMFGLGAFGSLMSGKFAGKVMKAGAVLVTVMGVVMLNNGTALSGFGAPFGGYGEFVTNTAPNAVPEIIAENFPGEIQDITTPLPRRGYPSLTVKAGIPVRWNLYADKGTVNGCNNAIIIPEYNIEKRLQTGDNIIEFTPARTGKFRYSCWMGMIRGTITVVDTDAAEPTEKTISEPGTASAAGCPCCGG